VVGTSETIVASSVPSRTASVDQRSWSRTVVAAIALRIRMLSPPTCVSGSAQSHRSSVGWPSAVAEPSALHSQLP
jgi:hypothetical protein